MMFGFTKPARRFFENKSMQRGCNASSERIFQESRNFLVPIRRREPHSGRYLMVEFLEKSRSFGSRLSYEELLFMAGPFYFRAKAHVFITIAPKKLAVHAGTILSIF